MIHIAKLFTVIFTKVQDATAVSISMACQSSNQSVKTISVMRNT